MFHFNSFDALYYSILIEANLKDKKLTKYTTRVEITSKWDTKYHSSASSCIEIFISLQPSTWRQMVAPEIRVSIISLQSADNGLFEST